ncbi:c6 transcription factor [Fusarium longipes]|uniref:C6 transcription factor n=1 Tax=Fusarium longipes TaxID=694270 RepID=A0A395SQT2_9HYPO|nr:c6 transcription factor [Fusarium longipes]
MIKDEFSMTDQGDTAESTPSSSLSSFDNSLLSQEKALNLYYANFHVAHSWMMSREALESLLKSSADDTRFLEATIFYIASRYSVTDSTSYWERAYEMSQESLPPTLWTVQALLSLSIASFGEENDYRSLFSQASNLALHLGLQYKVFADEQKELVQTESCRRTYWALYVYEVLLDMRNNMTCTPLYQINSTDGAELPCKEQEYEAGTIPAPISLADYDRLGASRDHSSWAYFIDLIRIHDSCVTQFPCEWAISSGELEDVNQRIDAWRNTLRAPKMERLGENGTVDIILYSALVISYG